MNIIDTFLNKITMYRLLLYGLLALALYSVALSFLGQLSYTPLELVLLFLTITFVSYFTNLLLSKLFRAVINAESAMITALILFFLLMPSSRWEDLLIVALAGIIAMASKYLLAYRKKHIFNPAACAVFAIYFLNSGAIWWIATSFMLPVVAVFGFLVVRKVRKIRMFLVFFVTALVVFLVQILIKGLSPQAEILQFITSFPLIFMGTIMLTEPLTTPPSHKMQYIYAILVGVLFSLQIPLEPIPLSPELALLIGNIFTFIVSPKYKLYLHASAVKQIASNTLEIKFQKPKNFLYKAGQYLEWTLPMTRTDSRGNRRYFTIASSPTENELKIGIKYTEPPSTFKKLLATIAPTKTVAATQLAGEFTLPESTRKKLLFIAGGIGITPFRSMIKYLIDTKQTRDIVLFYTNKTEDEIAYKEEFQQAESLGIKTIYVLTDTSNLPANFTGLAGRIDNLAIKTYAPDFSNRIIYLSGPNSMVNGYKKLLLSMGVDFKNIKTDYFPGF